MNDRCDLRSYAGETGAPFRGVTGHTDRELEAAYQRGITCGATRGIAWATLVIGLGCGWLLWSGGLISLAGLLP